MSKGYNRTALAAGLLVGIILVTILFRIKFYLHPPADGPVTAPIAYLSGALVSSIEPPFDTSDTTSTSASVTEPSSTDQGVIEVTPTAAAQSVFTATATHDLVTGVAPTSVQFGDHYLLGFLFEQRYVVKAYNAAWQPLQDDDTTLADDLKLINGAWPLTALAAVNNELYFLYVRPVDASASAESGSTVELRLKQFANSTEFNPTELKHEQTLLTNLLPTEKIIAAVGTDMITVSRTTAESAPPTLSIFSLAGQLLTEFSLSDRGTIRALIPDNNAVIVVSTESDHVLFTKVSRLGEILQTVQVALPEAETVVSAKRIGDFIAVQTETAVILFSNNLLKRYPALVFSSDQLYPTLAGNNEQLMVPYNTATSLTDYTMHVTLYAMKSEQSEPSE